jgi:formylglycine-generating enzyme required for sulfatase activity
MLGNAAELTASYGSYPIGIPALDPVPSPFAGLLVRGAYYEGPTPRAASQGFTSPTNVLGPVGFRLVRTVPGQYGQTCASDESCEGDLYCAQGVCQDGRGGDFCGSGECASGVCHDVAAGSEPSGSHGFGPPRCAPEGMVLVPGGEVEMGSPDGERGREASGLSESRFTASQPAFLWVSETEITQGEWRELVGTNPSEFPACGDDCPVENISWADAVAYANARSVAEGLTPCYRLPPCDALPGERPYCSVVSEIFPVRPFGLTSCEGYRLPTETEWELMARAGTTTATFRGDLTAADCRDATVGAAGWFCGNAGGLTHAVAGKEPNPNGLYDILGNVAEWVWDRPGDYPTSYAVGWTGAAAGSERVVRGGAYDSTADRLRSASRESRAAYDPQPGVGLRLVREPFVGGAPCTPFVDDGACLTGSHCVPTGRTRADGSLVGDCLPVLGDGPEVGELCDEGRRCGPGSTCVSDLNYCAPFCDPAASSRDDGACTAAADDCVPLTSGVNVCIEQCEPFESFPSGSCTDGRWCMPIDRDDTGGVCSSAIGSAPQGGECTVGTDCAPGHTCAYGRCSRYCDPEVTATCGTSRTCVAFPSPSGGGLEPFGRCVTSCDYDRGERCTGATDLCTPGEMLRIEEDACAAVGTFWNEGVPIEDGASCVEAGIPDGRFCSENAACFGGTCQRLCREAVGGEGLGYHPDCGTGSRCGFLSDDRYGLCVACSSSSTLLFTSFEGDTLGLVGDVSVRGWADGNYPNFADDEDAGGTDGDQGLAVHTWINGGAGGWSDLFAPPAAGTLVTMSANFHVERDVAADSVRMELAFFDGGGGRVGPSSIVEVLDVVDRGGDPTDEHEWRRIEISLEVPSGASFGGAGVLFDGERGVGTGAEGVRVDDVWVTTCN